MKTVTRQEIRDSLAAAGVARGRTVYVQADLRRVGMVEGARTREAFCDAYLDAIQELIGPDGTLVVPTYTTQVARFDMDFVWEETPTLMGIFPEHVRRHPDSLRSLHPIVSFTALGADKAAICAGNGPNGFGWESPFHRMHEADALCVTIGLESGYAVGTPHHLEAMFGVPYLYNKLLKWRPLVGGRPVERPFFLAVRWLELELGYDFKRWVAGLRTVGTLRSAPLGDARVYAANYRTSFAIGARALAEDPWFLLKQPPNFVYGRPPFDGPTAAREGGEGAQPEVNWAGYYLSGTAPLNTDEDP